MAYCRFAILQYAIVHDISNYFLSSLIKVSVFNNAKELVPEFSGTSSFVIYEDYIHQMDAIGPTKVKVKNQPLIWKSNIRGLAF